ncbi:MAG: ABC transporter ATP-binding protein, partial [Bacilli bacterium]
MLWNKYLAKYYRRYAWLYIIGIIALIGVDLIQVFIPAQIGYIVDTLNLGTLSAENKRYILTCCYWILAIAVGMFAGRIIWRFTIFMASQKIEAAIRHEMFLKGEKLSISYYHDNSVGTVMAWFTSDLETIEEFLGWGTIMLIDAVFLSVFALIFMFISCWQLTLIGLIPMVLIIFWGAIVEKMVGAKWTQRQKAFDELYNYSQESFTGIRVIKAFVKENQQLWAFSKVAKKNRDVNISFGKLYMAFDVILELIIMVILTLILCFGGWFVYLAVTGETLRLFGSVVAMKTTGQFVEFIGYFDILIWPLIALGQVVSMRSRAKASFKRITNFLEQPEDIQNPQNAYVLQDVKGEVAFKDFSFAYPHEDKLSLDDINLDIKAGEKIGIVGKIGCGKSTIMNILLRLYNVKEGTVFIDGHDVMACDINSVRNAIAYVPQDNFLFSDTITHNISFSDINMDDLLVSEAAKFADVDDDIQNFENKYETVSGERGVTLSGGQKQRISIARAFAKNAPIMILDDSVSA